MKISGVGSIHASATSTTTDFRTDSTTSIIITKQLIAQRATPRPQTSQAPQSPSVGYQGTSGPQRTVKDIMSEYPDVKVKNSGPIGTPLRKQARQNPASKKTFTRQPIYLHPMQKRLR